MRISILRPENQRIYLEAAERKEKVEPAHFEKAAWNLERGEWKWLLEEMDR